MLLHFVLAELNRVYEEMTPLFGEGEAILRQNPPIIIVQTRGKRKVLGWHGSRFWRDGEKEVHELCVSAETMNRDVEDICETLLHEMVHHYNALLGFRDCSNGYHNKVFRYSAEGAGLIVSMSNGTGWSRTQLGAKATAKIIEIAPRKDVFGAYRLSHTMEGMSQKGRMMLWECGCKKVRCAVTLQARCLECERVFERR